MQTLRDQACIVGVGETAYTRGSQKSVLRLVLEASRHAMADAGVTTHAIDGFVLPGPYLFQEQLVAHLGIEEFCMIVIVSGLPRSGTSLMMQMLQAGGMPLLIDDLRPPDADNPNGYWEYEPVKRLQQENSWIPKAEGKAVKVVSALLQYLPPQHTYKIIFMQRSMQEVLASQTVMLERRGEQSGKANDQTLGTVFAQHLDRTEHWLAMQKHMTVFPVNYHETIAAPAATAARVVQFLDLPLAVEAMAHAVDPRLHRQRGV